MFNNKLSNREEYPFENLVRIYNTFQLLLNNKHMFTHGLCSWVLFTHGLCSWVQYVQKYESISLSLFDSYIKSNLPLIVHINIFLSKFGIRIIISKGEYIITNTYSAFWWKAGEIEPRIKYIEKHMKRVKREIERRSAILPLGPGVRLNDDGYYI